MALVVLPQQEELDAMVEGFRRRGVDSASHRVGALECVRLAELDLLAAVGGHGKTQFAVQSQYLIDRLPEAGALLCAGAAGCLAEGIRFGDVIVGTETVEHDYTLRFAQAPLPRHAPDPALLAEFQVAGVTGTFPFAIHFKAIASGDEDVIETSRARELQALTGALCVAWEGSGGARAAQFNGVPFLEIRCITDHADEGAPASFRENLARVMPHVADLLIAWHSSRRRS